MTIVKFTLFIGFLATHLAIMMAHPTSAMPLNRPLLVSVTYPKVPSHRSLVRILSKSSLGYPVCYDVFA